MTLTNTQLILAEATDLLTREAESLLFKALRDAKFDVEALERIGKRKIRRMLKQWNPVAEAQVRYTPERSRKSWPTPTVGLSRAGRCCRR